MNIEISLFGSDTHLSKTIRLTDDGVLDKSQPGHNPTMCVRRETTSAADLAALIQSLQPYHALALGAMRDGMGAVDPESSYCVSPITLGSVDTKTARTLDNFTFREGQPAWMLLDRDGAGPDFETVFPILATVMRMRRASTSAGLHRKGLPGHRVGNSEGLHLYVAVKDGSDIPRATQVMHERLWLAGHGCYKLAKNGTLLDRSLVDVAVASPERLVYEGPPVLVGLEQDAETRRPVATEGDLLDTRAVFPDLTAAELGRLAEIKDAARAAIAPEAAKVAASYREERIAELVASGVSPEAAERHVAEYEKAGVLSHEHMLHFANLGTATVAQVLADPDRYHGKALADPVEGIGYGATTAKIYLKQNRRKINSMAHGGRLYSLPDRSVQEMFQNMTTIADAPFVPTAPPPPFEDAPPPPAATLPYGAVSMMSGGAAWLPAVTEDAIADDLVSKHEDRIRYCEERKQYFIWNGLRWFPDKTSAVYATARKHVRERVAATSNADASKMLKAAFISAVEMLSRRDQRIATTADMWDSLLYILNTPAGPVDLRTGALLPVDPRMLLSKTTSVAPGGDCPMWEKFLKEAMGGNQDDVDFLQRVCGMALSGEIRDHAIFFLYGSGGNGKSVFLSTISKIFDDYRQVMMQETITERGPGHDRHPTEIASLAGARLVTVAETEKGRRWAESRIKSLTGGDPISARVISGNPFFFTPQLTLMISGNHKPGLSSVGEAMRRRFHLIPFTHKPANPDPDLQKKLEAEHAGILAWMIEGTVNWYKDGLQAPKTVTDATAEYMSGEDAFGQWVEEKCVLDSNAWATRDALFGSWSRWTEHSREPTGNSRQFYETLRQRGFAESKKLKEGRGFTGIKLRPLVVPDRDEE